MKRKYLLTFLCILSCKEQGYGEIRNVKINSPKHLISCVGMDGLNNPACFTKKNGVTDI